MAKLHEFLGNHGVLASEFIFMSCGDFDGNTLKREAREKGFNLPNYMKRWINIKKVFPSHMFKQGLKEVDMKDEGAPKALTEAEILGAAMEETKEEPKAPGSKQSKRGRNKKK